MLGIIAAAVVMVGVVALLHATAQPVVSAGSEQAGYVGAVPPPNVRLPGFRLRNADGAILASDALRGKALVAMFVDTHCTTSCPIIASQVARGIDALTPQERSAVAALAFSVDPSGDTPANIRAFLAHNRATGQIEFLNGPLAAMRPIWKAFGVLSATDSDDADTHTSAVLIYNRDHVWVDTLSPGQYLTAENLAHDLRSALANVKPAPPQTG